jgi:hypothetical protein
MDRVVWPAAARPRPAGTPTQTLPVLAAVPAAVPALAEATGNRAGPSRPDWLAALAGDPRRPLWVRRTAAAATVGAILTIAVDWQLGAAAAAVTAAAEALYSSRTSVAIPASARASSARRRTSHRLARLAPAGHLTLRSRLIPGTAGVVEHLVTGPAGVYALTSQRWDRRLPARPSHTGHLFHGPLNQSALLAQAREQAGQASAAIAGALGQPVTVRPAVVIYGPPLPWAVMDIAGVDVVDGRKLRRYFRRTQRCGRLTDRQVELLHAAAAAALPPAP